MKPQYLQKGDVIEITTDMKVCVQLPECFVYASRSCSSKPARRSVTIGEVLNRAKPPTEKTLGQVAAAMAAAAYSDTGVTLLEGELAALVKKAVNAQQQPESFDTLVLIGQYVVMQTIEDASNGHHVFCSRLNSGGSVAPNLPSIDFYQPALNPAVVANFKPA